MLKFGLKRVTGLADGKNADTLYVDPVWWVLAF